MSAEAMPSLVESLPEEARLALLTNYEREVVKASAAGASVQDLAKRARCTDAAITLTLIAAHEKLGAPREQTLKRLAQLVQREAAFTAATGAAMLQHAIACGEALIVAEQRIPNRSDWRTWIGHNFPDWSIATSHFYMDLARSRSEILAGKPATMTEARALLARKPERVEAALVQLAAPHTRAADLLFAPSVVSAAAAADGIRRSIADALADESLSKGHTAVAQYVLEHFDSVIFETVEAVANNAETSTSTVVRFAQSVGFEGWPQLQEAMRDEFRGARKISPPPSTTESRLPAKPGSRTAAPIPRTGGAARPTAPARPAPPRPASNRVDAAVDVLRGEHDLRDRRGERLDDEKLRTVARAVLLAADRWDKEHGIV